MLYVTFCGATEIKIKERDNTVVTMWGATEVFLPTLAEKMIRAKESHSQQPPRALVVTVMGATAFTFPTLATEIESMKQLKDSGALTHEEMIDLWRQVATQDDLELTETVTFLGAAGNDRPSKEDELKDLARIAAKGVLTSNEYQALKSLLEGETLPALENEALLEKLRALIFPDPIHCLPRPVNDYTLPQR